MEKIVHPITGQKVRTRSKPGREILRQYVLRFATHQEAGRGEAQDIPPPPAPILPIPPHPPRLLRDLRINQWMDGVAEIRNNNYEIIGGRLGANYDHPHIVGICLRGCPPNERYRYGYWVVRVSLEPEIYRAVIATVNGVILRDIPLFPPQL